MNKCSYTLFQYFPNFSGTILACYREKRKQEEQGKREEKREGGGNALFSNGPNKLPMCFLLRWCFCALFFFECRNM